jgi:ABC-type uncharacterized transport system involved in gliding motility auxiliary subunit
MASKQGQDVKRALLSLTGLAALLVILILVNVIFSYGNIRWDATEDRIYSLSPGTKNILSQMTEPVTLEFFYSGSCRNLPNNLKLYARRVREFLSEYEHISQGRVRVVVHDPEPDSDEEEWAQRYRMRPLQLATGDKIYCGLVFLAADQEEKIDWLDASREGLLEYDITRIIYRLQSPEKKVLGIVSSLPVFGSGQNLSLPGAPAGQEPWFFVTELEKSYEVREIDLTVDHIDPAVDLLLIVHPREISPALQYAIDQYILSGGNALVAVDPFCISDRTQPRRGFTKPSGSSLEKLFSAWGLSMDPSKVVADLDQGTRVRSADNIVETNPVWISARGESLSGSNVISSELESMLLPGAGAIKKTEGIRYEFEPLIFSGKNAALINAFMAGFGASGIRRDFIPSGHPFNIAVRVSGRFKTAFPAGPPLEEASGSSSKKRPPETHLEAGTRLATLLILADADMLADEFYIRKSRFLGFAISQMFNDNLNFLSNACEVLTGSDALIGLRSRGRSERPFTVVLDLERKAQERWLAKEKELVQRIEFTNRKLQELEQKKVPSQKLIMSPEQEAEIKKFREEQQRIKLELKEVRKNLRADIEVLGTWLKGINIFLMPLLVSMAGIAFAIHRKRKVKKG